MNTITKRKLVRNGDSYNLLYSLFNTSGYMLYDEQAQKAAKSVRSPWLFVIPHSIVRGFADDDH